MSFTPVIQFSIFLSHFSNQPITKMDSKSITEQQHVQGMTYISNFVSEKEQKCLWDEININLASNWNKEEIKRWTQHYGWNYKYKTKNSRTQLEKAKPIPELFQSKIIQPLRQQSYFTNARDEELQIIVNQYLCGEVIGAHIDDEFLFGDTVVSVSLGCEYPMDFTPVENSKKRTLSQSTMDAKAQKISVQLELGSAVVLQNDARYKWKHGIAARRKDNGKLRTIRQSITIRTVLNTAQFK